MSKPPNTTAGATELIQSGGPSAPADTDEMMTTIRSRTAGRLVILDGPGKGQAIDFFHGTNSIGRDAKKNVIALDFGDAAIHREPHAYLSYSGKGCMLADNGKPNPLKLNGKAVTGSVTVASGDTILIGTTTLKVELA